MASDSSPREQVLGANSEPLDRCHYSLLPWAEQGSWLITGPLAGRGKAHAQKYSELLSGGALGSEKPTDQWASQYARYIPTRDLSHLFISNRKMGVLSGNSAGAEETDAPGVLHTSIFRMRAGRGGLSSCPRSSTYWTESNHRTSWQSPRCHWSVPKPSSALHHHFKKEHVLRNMCDLGMTHGLHPAHLEREAFWEIGSRWAEGPAECQGWLLPGLLSVSALRAKWARLGLLYARGRFSIWVQGRKGRSRAWSWFFWLYNWEH